MRAVSVNKQLRFMLDLNDQADPGFYCRRVARLIQVCNDALRIVYSKTARELARETAREMDLFLNRGYDPILLKAFLRFGQALISEHLVDYGVTFVYIHHTYAGLAPHQNPFFRAWEKYGADGVLTRLSPVLGYFIPDDEPETRPDLTTVPASTRPL